METTTARPFPWPLPGSAFAVLVLARITTALTWGWTAATAHPWNGYAWFQDALVISKHHTWVPGWSGFADALIANVHIVAPLFFLWNLYLFVMLLVGFATRLHGTLATGWAAVIAVLAVSIPKRGDFIPPDFPVPIGGWFWLLGPIVLFPLVAATSAGRLWGLDGRLRAPWTAAGGWRGRLARWM